MAWLPEGEKIYISIRFNRIHKREGQTPRYGIGRAYAQHHAAKRNK